jgi:hypothetical protein
MLGPAAIPGLRDFLADVERVLWVRITAAESLVKMAEQFSELREQAVAIITDLLGHFAEQERIVNGFLVEALCDLKAVESAGRLRSWPPFCCCSGLSAFCSQYQINRVVSRITGAFRPRFSLP